MYAEYSDKIKLSWTCDRCGHVNNRILTAKNMDKTENEQLIFMLKCIIIKEKIEYR